MHPINVRKKEFLDIFYESAPRSMPFVFQQRPNPKPYPNPKPHPNPRLCPNPKLHLNPTQKPTHGAVTDDLTILKQKIPIWVHSCKQGWQKIQKL